ncbi:DUF2480 family protein [Flavobacterium sp.]|uniref:DUF2480 family protein n=1 Tax=Flavobacterium sp. TaxID=239 RepID=UPI002626314D|nr:DUF2480 family protein [Flavobacterium sp.]
MEEIVNKVAQSVLAVFDLEDYYPKNQKAVVDIADFLEEGFILREVNFRNALKAHDWSSYKDKLVAVYCSTDAILPAWAPILVATHLHEFAHKTYLCPLEAVDTLYFTEILSELDYSSFADKPVILKGCSKKPVPEMAYLLAISRLQSVARSVMFGEACSAVPLYKKKK